MQLDRMGLVLGFKYNHKKQPPYNPLLCNTHFHKSPCVQHPFYQKNTLLYKTPFVQDPFCTCPYYTTFYNIIFTTQVYNYPNTQPHICTTPMCTTPHFCNPIFTTLKFTANKLYNTTSSLDSGCFILLDFG